MTLDIKIHDFVILPDHPFINGGVGRVSRVLEHGSEVARVLDADGKSCLNGDESLVVTVDTKDLRSAAHHPPLTDEQLQALCKAEKYWNL